METLPPRLTPEARLAILRIKEARHGLEGDARVPSYRIYEAVLDHGVRTPDEFRRYLARDPLVEAGHCRAVGNARGEPCLQKEVHPAISVTHRRAGDVSTWRRADGLLAMLVHHHLESPDEGFAVVEVEGPPKAPLVVEEFEFVCPALESVGCQPTP
jgi:hypothetical protein